MDPRDAQFADNNGADIDEQLRSNSFPEAQTLGKTLATWQEEIVRMWPSKWLRDNLNLSQKRCPKNRNKPNYRLRVIAQCG